MDERLLSADAIVFDVGNVLLRYEERRVVEMMPETLREPLTYFLYGPPHMWAPLDLGLEENEVIAQRIETVTGCPGAKETVLSLLRHFPEILTPLPLAGMLDELHGLGKKLYALTNYPEPSFTITEQRFPFFGKLDGIVVSAREKMSKPDPDLFRLLRDRYSLIPEKTLFIDDVEENVAAAAWVGFRVWHYSGSDTL